ncbi:MAG: hypothetical protein ACOY3P_11435 [Planctomycetota bacterium]
MPVAAPPRVSAGLQSTGDAAVARRRQSLLEYAAAEPLNLQTPNPKQQFPRIAARMHLGVADEDCLAYLVKGGRFVGKGSMFGNSSLASIVANYRSQIPAKLLSDVRAHILAFPEYLSGGTENHIAMKRTAGLLFGQCFPEATFHHELTGRELELICRQYVRDYARTIYHSSMREYLSPVYHSTNTSAWVNLHEAADDDESRLLARAILDWMFADLAINSHCGLTVPPWTRDRNFLKGTTAGPKSNTGTTAWLYWGAGREEVSSPAGSRNEDPANRGSQDGDVDEDIGGGSHHARAKYMPPQCIRNLGAKQLATPFMLLQARCNADCHNAAESNRFFTPKEQSAPQPRHHLRSVYVARDYGLGVGYFREARLDTRYVDSIACGAVWRTSDQQSLITVSHPYWYAGFKPHDWPTVTPDDMRGGHSPYQQAVHWENAAIVLCVIPATDPQAKTRVPGDPAWPVTRLKEPVQACFVHVPDEADERVETRAGYFLREGDVYLAIRPLVGGSTWDRSRLPRTMRLTLTGAVTGCVLEMGDRAEYGSFSDFQQAVGRAELDTSRLQSEKAVTYRSTRGHALHIRHLPEGGLPDASVNGTKLDFDRWPISASPYLNSENGVLDVNDGREGLTIDFSGDLPRYTHYQLVGANRVATTCEELVDRKLRVTEGARK